MGFAVISLEPGDELLSEMLLFTLKKKKIQNDWQ